MPVAHPHLRQAAKQGTVAPANHNHPGRSPCASPATRKVTMPQAIMNPEEVRRFAQELKQFNTELQTRTSLLHGRFSALSDTWQDQEHRKFSEEFKQTMKTLQKFVEVSNEHIPFLLRKAQRIEEYLNQR